MKIEGIQVYFYENVTSTMDVAEKFALEGNRAIVLASEQTGGRGRYGKRWLSLPGGLYFSLVVTENEGFPFSELISFTIVRTLEHFHVCCNIKLPNDIIINRKKISGILITRKGTVYIAGIGINVNNETGDDAERTSMKQVLGVPVEKKTVFERFVRNFVEYERAFAKDPQTCLELWRAHLIK